MAEQAGVVPFVGRDADRRTIRRLLGKVAGGQAAVLIVEGEAGIGKTRLLHEALEVAGALDVDVARGAVKEFEQSRPFGAVAHLLGLSQSSPDAERASIAELLWADTGDATDDVASVVAGPGMRFRVLEAIVQLVDRATSARSTVLALEDVHWCDPSSLLTLHALRRRLGHRPLGLVLSCRPIPRSSDLVRTLAALVAEAGEHVRLGPLADADVARLAEAVVGAPPGESLRRQLPSARGNPLFLIELLRALRDDGALATVAGRVELTRTALPASLRIMLLRRLSYLSSETLNMLKVAAVLGSTFEVSSLALVTQRTVVQLLPLLDEAMRAGLLDSAGTRLAFRHDLIREAVYADLAPALRAALHVEAGRALAAAGGPAIEVAEHLSIGAAPGDVQAVRWLHEAGREALGRAPTEALELLERAVALSAPGDPGVDAILADRVRGLLWAGRVPDAESAARDLLRRPHDPAVDTVVRLVLIATLIAQGRVVEGVQECQAAMDRPDLPGGVRAQLLAHASLGLLFTGDIDAATAAADESCAEGDRWGDPLAVWLGLNSASMIAAVQGRVADAVCMGREALRRADRRDSRETLPYRWHTSLTVIVTSIDADLFAEAEAELHDGRRRCEDFGITWPLSIYEWAFLWLTFRGGAWDAAIDHARAGLRRADGGCMRFGAVSAHSALALIAFHRNDLRGAQQAVVAAEAELARSGPQYLSEWLLWAKAMLVDASGHAGEAAALLGEAWDLCGPVLHPELGPDYVRWLLAAGDAARAGAVTEHIEVVAARMATPSATGAALCCRGLIESDGGILREGIDAYRRGPRPFPMARACEDAAGLVVGAEARALYEEAAGVYERLGAGRDAARVVARLRALGSPRGARGARRRRPHDGWRSMTRAEQQVATLALEGLTNREIGARLFVSCRTVETHLGRVYAKLGVSSRNALRAAAADRAEPPATPTAPAAGPATR